MSPQEEGKNSYDPITRIEAKLDELLEWKDGDNKTPGVKVRLDRIEQRGLLSNWLFSSGLSAAVAILAAWLTAKWSGKP